MVQGRQETWRGWQQWGSRRCLTCRPVCPGLFLGLVKRVGLSRPLGPLLALLVAHLVAPHHLLVAPKLPQVVAHLPTAGHQAPTVYFWQGILARCQVLSGQLPVQLTGRHCEEGRLLLKYSTILSNSSKYSNQCQVLSGHLPILAFS